MAAEATPIWVIIAAKGTGKAPAAGAISGGLFGGTFAVAAAAIPDFCVVAQVTGAAMSAYIAESYDRRAVGRD